MHPHTDTDCGICSANPVGSVSTVAARGLNKRVAEIQPLVNFQTLRLRLRRRLLNICHDYRQKEAAQGTAFIP